MNKNYLIHYLPQIHTFKDNSGIQSQKNICNRLIEIINKNPKKHYYIFFEHDCVKEIFDFYTNPDGVLTFMEDFEGVVEVIQDELPDIAPFFKTKLDFENINTKTWLRELETTLEHHEDHVKKYILGIVFTNYDKYRIYSYIFGLRWVHDYVHKTGNQINIEYIPVPCFQRVAVVENKLTESEQHYQNDILAVIKRYQNKIIQTTVLKPVPILWDVKAFFERRFETNPHNIDMNFLYEYKTYRNFTDWFKHYGVLAYPPKHQLWNSQLQNQFENELLDAIFSDITFTNREYLTIKDIQQYLNNDTYDKNNSEFFLIFGVSHDFEKWNKTPGMFLKFVQDDTVTQNLKEYPFRSDHMKSIQHYRRKSIIDFIDSIE